MGHAWRQLAAVVALGASACTGDLFVSAELHPDEDCQYTPSAELALERAVYDVSQGTTPENACARTYVAHLLTENPSTDSVLVRSAEVKLTTVQDQTVIFGGEAALPNPFLITVMSALPGDGHGVASVQVIPMTYAASLGDFVDGSIVAHIRLFAKTAGGDELRSNLFSLQIEVCDGCLTVCDSELKDRDVTIENLLGGERCDGSTETGGRVCVDPGC